MVTTLVLPRDTPRRPGARPRAPLSGRAWVAHLTRVYPSTASRRRPARRRRGFVQAAPSPRRQTARVETFGGLPAVVPALYLPQRRWRGSSPREGGAAVASRTIFNLGVKVHYAKPRLSCPSDKPGYGLA
jgi:hypothetical protein